MDTKFTSNSIPVDLRELLVRLEFLSMNKRGNKINTNNMSFVSADSWFGCVKRAFNHENRKTSLQFIINTVDLTIDYINKYSTSEFLRIIINSLSTARIGICELATTYRNDPEIVSNLKVCLANIDIQLNKHKHLIKGNEEINDPDSSKSHIVIPTINRL